ncbi:MAG: helicase [Phycisphaerales bacterium]|nr:helicase [Phycisphaerales bacterium]
MAMDVRQVLSESGPVARALGPSFESRPEQIEMAEAVATAMETRSHLVVEAGTGVGKSFAYLVPAMLRALERGERVVIATNTISLQEQLIQKDIPFLRSLLAPETVPLSVSARPDPEEEHSAPGGEALAPRPVIKAVLVKGRGNYVSIRRLRLASQRQDKLLSDAAARRSLHAIEDWALETTDGTLSTLPPLERPGVWDKVESDSGNCMGRKCPSYRECFYQRARAEMESANILVCNHALFFSDLALRSQEVGFLPTYQHVILDEAHNVEDVASEHFGLSIAEGRVFHLLSTLYGARSGKGYLPHLQLLTGDLDTVDRAIRLVMQADAAARGFFDSLVDLTRRGPAAEEGARKSYSPGLNSGLRIRAAAAVENVLSPVMRELSLRLKALRESVKNDADKYELNSYSQRAAMIADDAEMLLDQSLPGCAYWAETGGQDDEARYRRVTLACAPVEVAPLLKDRLFGQDWSVVLTSATLATRQVKQGEASESAEMAFAHVLSRLGCEGARTLQLGSPFDHARQVELYVDLMTQNPRNATPGSSASAGAGRPGELRYVPDDGPSPVRGPGPGSSYTDQLAERILHHVGETDGGAFVLFTSFASLNAVASRITGPLGARGIPVLAQGRDGPRSQILERFRESERSVLLGAASFWQGVDVRGRGLRNVIITKLPFDPPDRPLTEARGEVIEARGGDPFGEDSLPRAVIRFKQGFGRLIRSKSDHGRVVVLDPRILTARYGRVFLAALPKGLEARILRDQG